MKEIFSTWMLMLAFAGLIATFLAPAIIIATPALRRMRKPITVFACLLTLYAGAKHLATITFPTLGDSINYFQDSGSYVTNDYVHVEFTTVVIPQTANLFVYRRQIDSTNDIDWVEHLATTIGEFDQPQDIQFAAATNFDWIVFSTWTPGPAVETNGVWHAYWGLDQQRHESLIPVRTMIRVDDEVIATPKSKADSEERN